MNKVLYFLIALLIKLTLSLPMQLLGLILVPVGLRYGFKGVLWPWGNKDHPDNGGNFWKTKCGNSWWCAYQWFALRNPTFNWGKYVLGIKSRPYIHIGNTNVGDKTQGGSYWCFAFPYFEYYLIFPYSKTKCIRIRFGWKLYNKTEGDICQFCFVINPLMTYKGVY